MKPLTAKQSRFCELVSAGMSGSEAYRASYNAAGMNPASIRQEAHRLQRLPHLAEAIARLREQDSAVQHSTDRLRNEWILQRLQGEATNLRNPAAVRVRALEILARTQGMFTDVRGVGGMPFGRTVLGVAGCHGGGATPETLRLGGPSDPANGPRSLSNPRGWY